MRTSFYFWLVWLLSVTEKFISCGSRDKYGSHADQWSPSPHYLRHQTPGPGLCQTTDTNWSAFPWHCQCSTLHTMPDVFSHQDTSSEEGHWFSPLLSWYCEQCQKGPPSGPCHHQSDRSDIFTSHEPTYVPFFTLLNVQYTMIQHLQSPTDSPPSLPRCLTNKYLNF